MKTRKVTQLNRMAVGAVALLALLAITAPQAYSMAAFYSYDYFYADLIEIGVILSLLVFL